MVRPERAPLAARVEADETWSAGRHRAGQAVAPPARRWSPGRSKPSPARAASAGSAACGSPPCPTPRPRACRAFSPATPPNPWRSPPTAGPATLGLAAKGYDHAAINLSRSWGAASWRLPAVHLVFSLAKRWLLGTHHGAVRPKHLQAYLDELVFRFNRRTARRIAHRFARLIQHAVLTPPTTYRAIVAGPATDGRGGLVALERSGSRTRMTLSLPSLPIYLKTLSQLDRLLRVRHILVHELPRVRPYAEEELPDFLAHAKQFLTALEWLQVGHLYGKVRDAGRDECLARKAVAGWHAN